MGTNLTNMSQSTEVGFADDFSLGQQIIRVGAAWLRRDYGALTQ